VLEQVREKLVGAYCMVFHNKMSSFT
jgi:hypothetical protein